MYIMNLDKISIVYYIHKSNNNPYLDTIIPYFYKIYFPGKDKKNENLLIWKIDKITFEIPFFIVFPRESFH